MTDMNRLCKKLGIKHPVIQVGMAGAATADLISTVSNSGGLGIEVSE
jgi:nitronate monooxygenase